MPATFEHICQMRWAGGAGEGRDHSCTHLCLPETMLAPGPSGRTLLRCGVALRCPVCSALLWWSHYGLCPHNTKKPSQAMNNNSSEGLPWSGRLCAGHRNLISHFVTGTGTRGACGGSWACVTCCCWQPGTSVMCGDEAGGRDVEEGPLFQ